jgi:hypothetical protein
MRTFSNLNNRPIIDSKCSISNMNSLWEPHPSHERSHIRQLYGWYLYELSVKSFLISWGENISVHGDNYCYHALSVICTLLSFWSPKIKKEINLYTHFWRFNVHYSFKNCILTNAKNQEMSICLICFLKFDSTVNRRCTL